MKTFLTALLGLVLLGCTPTAPGGMIPIPAGPFIMGTNQEDSEERGLEFGLTKPWFEDESPAHSVDLPLFYIDRLEVTNRDFARFLEETQSIPPLLWEGSGFPPGKDFHPATGINWFQAEAYCLWVDKRLPREAEWGKASRGPAGLIYPWGNTFEIRRANLLSEGTHAVGSFPQGASPYKVEDTIGNVWEWTADWYRPYPGNRFPSENYGMSFKVIRGKSFTEGFGHFPPEESHEIVKHEARALYRLFFNPKYSFGDLGFRCAKDA